MFKKIVARADCVFYNKAGLPDFSRHNAPKAVKNIPNYHNITK
jgi:hypothetical protein